MHQLVTNIKGLKHLNLLQELSSLVRPLLYSSVKDDESVMLCKSELF